jgi:DNA polymerase-3 subunit beta
MEFTINREIFLNGIQKTLGIVEKQISLPVLQNVLIRTIPDANAIEILATNREISIRTDYDASVIKEGQLTIPAKKLNEILKELQGETVHLAVKGKKVCVITCDKVVCKINGIDAADFPATMDSSECSFFEISPVLLADMVKKVIYAVSQDNARKNLSGIAMQKIYVDNIAAMRLCATDGNRLAVSIAENFDDIMQIPGDNVIIPRKGFTEIKKIAEDTENNLQIGFTKGACVVEADRATLWVNLIDGQYPDIQRVIPDENKDGVLNLVVEREAILHSLRRMAVYGDGCSMDINGGSIHFEANDPVIGEIKDEIAIADLDVSVSRTVKFNIRFLIEAIEVLSEKKIALNIHDNGGPGVIHGADNKNYTAVVMPLRG